MTVVVYENCYTCWNDCPADARDKCVCLYSAGTDPDSALLSRETKVANIDSVNAGGQIERPASKPNAMSLLPVLL